MAILTLTAILRHASLGIDGVGIMGFEIALAFVLVVITAFDLKWKLVPMEFVLGSTIILAAYRILLGASVLQLALGAIVIGILLGMLVFASRGMMMGEGDPFVGLLMGAVLGFPLALLGLLISFIVGGSVAAALLIERMVTRKTEVAFVPFLAIGTLIAYWWSEPLELLLRYAIG
jgi:prepilin signal peptidase PulO-like enzyme (type II secretory pathway)